MGKSKKEHRAKVAKRNEKIIRQRQEFQYKLDKLKKLISENAMIEANRINQEVEEAQVVTDNIEQPEVE
jgi:protein-arginine kinase activator protein McsA